MNPCTHGQLGDEDVATFGKQDWGFRRYHLDLGIRFHNLLDACQWQLMNLVIVSLSLQIGNGLLPIGRQDVPILAMESLADLRQLSVSALALSLNGLVAYVCPCW